MHMTRNRSMLFCWDATPRRRRISYLGNRLTILR